MAVTFLVRFALPNNEAEPVGRERYVGCLEANNLTSAKSTGEPDEQDGPVAFRRNGQSTRVRIVRKGLNHKANIFG